MRGIGRECALFDVCAVSTCCQIHRALAVAYKVETVGDILQIPLLVRVGYSILGVAYHIGITRREVQHVHTCGVIGYTNEVVEAVIATILAVGRHGGGYIPLLHLRRFRIIQQRDIVSRPSGILRRALVHQPIDTCRNRNYGNVLTPRHIDDTLRIGLAFLVARSSRQRLHELVLRTVAVVVDQPVGGHQLVSGRHCLTLTAAHECLDAAVVVAPYRGCRPVGAVLAVGQALALAAYLTELATGAAVKSPPDAVGHAVLQAHHSLRHVMHLVGIAHLAVVGQLLIETGKGVERASQLVGVAPLVEALARIVPFQRLVVVQRVAAHHDGLGTTRVVLLEQACHLIMLQRRSALLLRPVVALVERRDAQHGVLCILLYPVYVAVDHRRPMLIVGDTILDVIAMRVVDLHLPLRVSVFKGALVRRE